MRNFQLYQLAAAIALVVAGCGSSSSQVMAARTARYQGDKVAIFHAARGAVAAKYKIAKVDEVALTLVTTGRWYTPDGLGASVRMDDIRDVPDKSIHLAFTLKLVPDGKVWVVDLEPHMYRLHAGSPEPEPVKPGDLSLPGWVSGRINALALAVNGALKPYEVHAVPAMVPAGGGAPGQSAAPAAAPTATPGGAPGATPAAAPAAGSAPAAQPSP